MKKPFLLRARTHSGLVLAAASLMGTAALAQSNAPTFTQTIEPSAIGPGGTSSLRFAIFNGGTVPAEELAFTDTLPAAMALAVPSGATSTCGGVLSAPGGGSAIAFSDGSVGAGASCTIAVGITSNTVGTHQNTSGDLTSSLGNSGSSAADLTVVIDRPGFSKAFSPNAVFIGGRSTLTLTIDNSANASRAANLSFTDQLPVGMLVAHPANASTTCAGGVLTAAAGSSVIQYGPRFSGDASVADGASCTVTVGVVAAAVGTLVNTTRDLTSTPLTGGPARSSGKATAALSVEFQGITLSKSFVDDPVAPGYEATLEFTVRNLDRGASATQIAFSDDLDQALSGLVATTLPSDPCGPGSTLTGSGVLSLAGGQLDPEATCVFSVTLSVPAAAPSGSYTNTTSPITADVGGAPVTGNAAVDVLFIEPAPLLTKAFVDDPVGAGGSVELEFSITNTSLTSDATEISFEDVFVSELPTATSVPADGFCGAFSVATYTPLVDSTSTVPARVVISGAELASGATCTFSLVLDVAVDAAFGTYPNTTSEVTALVAGDAVSGRPATDDLVVIEAPRLSKEYVDDPVVPDGVVALQFTLEHDQNAPSDATAIAFSDDLAASLAGLQAIGLPLADPCGAGSSLDGTSTLLFTGGSLAPGESCTFSVSVQVPLAAPAGRHTNTTSSVQAAVAGVTAGSRPGSDDLVIAGLQLSKEFIDDPVLPGTSVTVRYTIDNTSPRADASDIVFVDDLDAALDQLTGTGLPIADPCGVGSTLSGSAGDTRLVLQNGALVAGGSCTFDVSLNVPAAASAGTYVSATSGFRATQDGGTVVFDNASDELTIVTDLLSLSKEFLDDPIPPGAPVILRFAITNLSPNSAVSDIAFTDDLTAALAGLVSTSGALADSCGVGSSLTGIDELVFSAGELAAGASCTFDVALAVPADAPIGTIARNVTSLVSGTVGGFAVTGDPAVDELQIDALTFGKSFDGDATVGGSVGLTFTIQNLSGGSASELSFLDDLEAMIPGLVAVGLPLVDVCGTGSMLDGTSTVALEGGNLLPGGSCTFSIDVQVPASTVPGDYLNVTTDLRQFGVPTADPAQATLTVLAVSDSDDDGVVDGIDVCPGTLIPEGVPTIRLGVNRHALVDGDWIFDTTPPPGGGGGPGVQFTTADTGGCSCEQIIKALGLGNGHTKFGCSTGAMNAWVAGTASGSSLVFFDDFEDGDATAWLSPGKPKQ